MKTKKCNFCKQEKCITEFHKGKKEGLLFPRCKLCRKDYDRKFYLKNKEKVIKRNKSIRKSLRDKIQKIKASKGCKFCKESHPCCLDFHHIKNKKYEIADMVSKGLKWDLIENEINKCIVVCANCHRKIHAGVI